MTEGYCALAELCETEITDGTHQTPVYSDKGYIFLSSKNVTSGVIDWENVKYISEDLHNELYARIKPQMDDILLAKNGTTGIAALVDRDEIFDIYVSLALIRPDKNKVLPQYLLYAINSSKSQKFFKSNLKGIGVPNLHLTHIRETPIKIYSLPEQSQIVERLRYVDDLLRKYTQKLSTLDNLVKSRFIEMFGDINLNEKTWATSRMEDICESIGDGLHGTPKYDEQGKIPFINGNNLDGTIIHTSTTKYIDEEEYKRLFIHLSNNAILLSINGTLGKLAYYCGEKLCLGKSAAYFNVKQDYNRIFVYELMRTEQFQQYLESNSTKSTIKNVGLKALRDYKIITPPHDLQNQFADFVQQADKSKLAVQQSIDTLQTLKDKLMQDYFG